MTTISLCMIVKNEGEILDRCLSSIVDLMDEVIIVDTGSTDNTKEIASKYTSLIYDFEWIDDFSAARNFAFSKATKEYIYAPDADEVIDEENHKRFKILKQLLLPEIEVVQMHYITQLEHNTVQNFSNELRPKLFKRLREFTWIDPVHETIRLQPIVFDSDIEILHLPQSNHGKRDFDIFEKYINKEGSISDRLGLMYAKELYKCGDLADIERSMVYFENKYEDEVLTEEAHIILARYLRLSNNAMRFQKEIIGNISLFAFSEICCEIGYYFEALEEYDIAIEWFKRAIEQAEPIINIEASGSIPLEGLARTYYNKGETALAEQYQKAAEQWELPKENT